MNQDKLVEARKKEIIDLFDSMGFNLKESMKQLFDNANQKADIAKQNWENFRYTKLCNPMFQAVDYMNIELSALYSIQRDFNNNQNLNLSGENHETITSNIRKM